MAGDVSVTFWSQRNHAGGITSRWLLLGMSMHQCASPLQIDSEIICGIIDIPLADTGRAATNLGEFQPPGAGKPFHVCSRGTNPQHTIHIARHLPYITVSVGLDTVGRHHLW